MKLNNNKGVALILSYIVLSSLITLAAGFALSSVSELNNARRFRDSTIAFWAAEGGVNEFIKNTAMLNSTNPQTIAIGNSSVTLNKDDSDTTTRVITVTATLNNYQRNLQLEFPALAPPIYDNTISSGGNMTLTGFIARTDVHGKTRLTGTFSKSSGTTANFDDKLEGQSSSATTLKYPDSNNNGTSDEFADFVEFNRDIVSTYPPSQVVYVQSSSTQTIVPSTGYAGKKIIYVEGTTAGSGDVNIVFDASCQENQNLTVISTGKITYVQPLQSPAWNSKLNTVSWEGYSEPSFLVSPHSGATYTHGTTNITEVIDYSTSNGILVSNGNIALVEALAFKTFNYGSSLDEKGQVPPGFEGLITTLSSGYSSTPSSWKEI